MLYLLDDAGTALLTPGVVPGVSGFTENSQCRVNGAASLAVESGATLTLTVALDFKASFVGRKIIYGGAQAVSGANSGWQALGPLTVAPPPAVDVLMSQYNPERTGTNPAERTLRQSNVNPTQFGKLFARSVDASLYALPLIASGVSGRNLLIAATMANTVYAFDADTPAATASVWSRNLGTPFPSSTWTGPVTWGILSTPVIDRTTSTVYVVAKLVTPSATSSAFSPSISPPAR